MRTNPRQRALLTRCDAFEGAVDQIRQWRVPLHGCDAWLDGGYFTGDDGHITNRIEIIAAHDEEAKQLAAKQLVDGHAVSPPSLDDLGEDLPDKEAARRRFIVHYAASHRAKRRNSQP